MALHEMVWPVAVPWNLLTVAQEPCPCSAATEDQDTSFNNSIPETRVALLTPNFNIWKIFSVVVSWSLVVVPLKVSKFWLMLPLHSFQGYCSAGSKHLWCW